MSAIYTYKTRNGVQTGFIPGAGEISQGVIRSAVPIENPNLELVSDTGQAPVVGTVTQAQSNPALNQTAGPQQPTNTGVQS
jgi:hypothetical protein